MSAGKGHSSTNPTKARLTASIPPMMTYIRSGNHRVLSTRGYTANTSAAANTKDTPTSAGVWTPRYIRDTGTARRSATHTILTHTERENRATPPSHPTAHWVWPLGKL